MQCVSYWSRWNDELHHILLFYSPSGALSYDCRLMIMFVAANSIVSTVVQTSVQLHPHAPIPLRSNQGGSTLVDGGSQRRRSQMRWLGRCCHSDRASIMKKRVVRKTNSPCSLSRRKTEIRSRQSSEWILTRPFRLIMCIPHAHYLLHNCLHRTEHFLANRVLSFVVQLDSPKRQWLDPSHDSWCHSDQCSIKKRHKVLRNRRKVRTVDWIGQSDWSESSS